MSFHNIGDRGVHSYLTLQDPGGGHLVNVYPGEEVDVVITEARDGTEEIVILNPPVREMRHVGAAVTAQRLTTWLILDTLNDDNNSGRRIRPLAIYAC